MRNLVLLLVLAIGCRFVTSAFSGQAGESALPHSLPHRPLSQIDIQGHQLGGTAADQCPGRYTYRMPASGEILYCWGRR